ncbi:hypothetical protein [Halorubrum ezzemoulense]|uniref:hypothetical protein n=1 Tax=Halorubrum ezzemoulense TaxID=337243 RepID=UPI00232C3F5E|nr:hypothetical protein [Halorubrum ezzemoulense]MDB2280764.1 hypothetical protein [Halorubrum ezzemoulense]MDB9251378.1 hypothetical protein [Halorubrum ezzemoulense]MDB9255787.1 hypothetical protein [Halorubrum ezzemoulense]MDB9276498.1 hypothetical protein [Halorubrum ezzemoulense]
MADAYRGVFGAIPYAFRATESWTMRAYAALGALAAGFVALVVTLALVVWMGETVSAQGGTFLFSRSLFVVAGLGAVGPLLAPILFVARRHRRGDRVAATYDRWMGVAGFLFLLSLYLGMVISAPEGLRDPSGSVLVNALYALPQLAGFVPPVAAALAVFATHFRLRGGTDDGAAVDDDASGDAGGPA